MNRRDFLGTVIGSFVVSRLPFVAEPTPPAVPEPPWRAAWTDWRRCRLALVSDHGEFLAPPVKDVVHKSDGLVFFTDDVMVHRAFTTTKMKVLSPGNTLLAEDYLDRIVYAHAGDKLLSSLKIVL